MPDLSALLANECWVDVEAGGGTFKVAYRPETASMLRQAELQKKLRFIQSQENADPAELAIEIAKILVEIVVGWDLTQNGQLLPITPEVIAGVIPADWVNPIFIAISNDRARSQEEKKVLSVTSGAGLPTAAKPAPALNGIPSSEPRGTWA